jgi:hypothetical protein
MEASSKLDVTGGPAVTIADIGSNAATSGSWNQDDVILFGTLNKPVISRVSVASGTAAPVTEPDKARTEAGQWAPWFLPDGRHFLYAIGGEKGGVWVGDLKSRTPRQVVGFGTRTIYVNPGYLLYVRDRTLMAQPFDTGKLAVKGDAVPVAEEVDTFVPSPSPLLGHFSASQNGVLMYTSSRGTSGNVQLTWFDRMGRKLDTVGAPGLQLGFSLSPDGTTVAYTRQEPQTALTDIWMHDLVHGSESRLTFVGNNQFPVWSRDGTLIFFYKDFELYRKAANNTGPEEAVEAAKQLPMDASRDGRYLLTITNRNTPKTGNDIWVLPLFGDHKPFPFLATEFSEGAERLAPDGRWLAYQSNESKDFEIYVESFPQKGGRWQVSNGGGTCPVWSRDGRELYYYSRDGKIMAVDIKPGPQSQFGVPKPVFAVNLYIAPNASFEVSRDGRFLLPALVEHEASAPMTVVLNWPELFKKK